MYRLSSMSPHVPVNIDILNDLAHRIDFQSGEVSQKVEANRPVLQE